MSYFNNFNELLNPKFKPESAAEADVSDIQLIINLYGGPNKTGKIEEDFANAVNNQRVYGSKSFEEQLKKANNFNYKVAAIAADTVFKIIKAKSNKGEDPFEIFKEYKIEVDQNLNPYLLPYSSTADVSVIPTQVFKDLPPPRKVKTQQQESVSKSEEPATSTSETTGNFEITISDKGINPEVFTKLKNTALRLAESDEKKKKQFIGAATSGKTNLKYIADLWRGISSDQLKELADALNGLSKQANQINMFKIESEINKIFANL
jgi:hypothetical protein